MSTSTVSRIRTVTYKAIDARGTVYDFGVTGQDQGYGRREMPFAVIEEVTIERGTQRSRRGQHVASAYTLAMAEDIATGLNARSGWTA